MEYESFLSQAARERKESPIRALFPLLSIPGMGVCLAASLTILGIISLGSGNPNPTKFPIASLSFTLKGESLSVIIHHNFTLSPEEDGVIEASGRELDHAMQYSETKGVSPPEGSANSHS
jgi:hypothetical protein